MKPLIFQPYKKGVISGEILSIIACAGIFAYIMFDSGGTPSRRLLIFMGILIAAFALVFIVEGAIVVKSAGYRTKIEVDRHGFTVIAPKCPEPMFIPWNEEVHMCVCTDGEVYPYHWVHEKILCFSNQDISGQWIERAQTVNYRQTFETDAGQPWAVALTYGSKAKCKKDAARVRQYMSGCLQQAE